MDRRRVGLKNSYKQEEKKSQKEPSFFQDKKQFVKKIICKSKKGKQQNGKSKNIKLESQIKGINSIVTGMMILRNQRQYNTINLQHINLK